LKDLLKSGVLCDAISGHVCTIGKLALFIFIILLVSLGFLLGYYPFNSFSCDAVPVSPLSFINALSTLTLSQISSSGTSRP